jgi:hypothetical protein
MTANRIIQLMLTTYGDLTVGKPGRSFKLISTPLATAQGNADCVVKKLPANSTPTTLPLGNGVFSNLNKCDTSTNIPTGAAIAGRTYSWAKRLR